MRDQIDELTLLVHEIRNHQLRRRLTNERHMKKKQRKQQSTLAMGDIPIPVRGAICDNALKARGARGARKCRASGKPSTRFPLERLVEQER